MSNYEELTDSEVTALQATQTAGEDAAGAGLGNFQYSKPNEPFTMKGTRQQWNLLQMIYMSQGLRPYKSDNGDRKLRISAGKWFNGDTEVSFTEADVDLTDATTNYVYITAAGTATVSTTSFPVPSVTPHIPICEVTCASGTYAYDDIDHTPRFRAFITVCGSEAIEELTVYNDTGVQIDAGKILSVSGWDATNSCFEVVLADADDPGLPGQLVASENISDTSTGIAVDRYDLTSVDTSGATGVGADVYLSTTAGGWTLTAPTGADQIAQRVGQVTAKDAAAGAIRFDVGLIATQEVIGTARLQDSAVTADKIAAAVAGDGLQGGAGSALAVDVSDFAGKGVTDDGSENLDLDINSCDAAAVDLTADSMAILDATDSASKKEAIADVISAMAGDGLLQDGTTKALGVDASDIAGTGLEDDGSENLRIAAAAAGDGLQGGAGSALAVDVSDFAGKGVKDDGSENIELDINSCDAAAVDLTADSFAILDATDSASKKEAIADFLGAIAGSGITCNAGTKVLDITTGGVTDAMLSSSLCKRIAMYAFGYVDFSGRPADDELLTINGRKYETDDDGDFPQSGGDVQCDLQGNATLDEDITDIATAINGDGSATVTAVADTTNDILWLYAATAGAAGNSITLVTALTNTTASGATLTDGADAAVAVVWPLRHTITAQEATDGILRFDTGLTSIEAVQVMLEDAGVLKHAAITIDVTGGIITISEGDAWANNDVLDIIAIGTE